MKTIIGIAVLGCSIVMTGCATTGGNTGLRTEKCARIDEPEVAKLFDRWNASLKVSADRAASNYTKNAVLLPTLSNDPHAGQDRIREYFVNFVKLEPVGKIDERFVKIGCNVVQDVGLYTFTFHGTEVVPARYTFVYEYTDGQWLISHHHSSGMPKK